MQQDETANSVGYATSAVRGAYRLAPADYGDTSTSARAITGPVPHSRICAVPTETGEPAGPTTASAGTDWSATTAVPERTIRSWPLVLLAAPASVAVWSGWVGIGRMTGFGQVHPLPGIWDSFHLNSAVTLPIGVEAYAAYALRAWLSAGSAVSTVARRFARWSALASLLLGMAGQVAYHLLADARVAHAPWAITTAVACLPVLVLGMGAALAHLLRTAPARGGPDHFTAPMPPAGPPDQAMARAMNGAAPVADDGPEPDRSAPSRAGRTARLGRSNGSGATDRTAGPSHQPNGESQGWRRDAAGHNVLSRLAQAHVTASQLTAAGVRVSRRKLRGAGLRGSNAELGALARIVGCELASQRPAASLPSPQDR